MSEQEQHKQQNTEGSPWFWKIFGSAIVGALTFLFVAHITNINSNIERSKSEVKMDIKELKIISDSSREKISDLEKTKTEIASIAANLKEISLSFDEKKQRITAIEVSLEHQKKEIEDMKLVHEKLNQQILELKEKMMVSEVKKTIVEEQKLEKAKE